MSVSEREREREKAARTAKQNPISVGIRTGFFIASGSTMAHYLSQSSKINP